MTNKERLISLLGFAPDNNALDGALLDVGLAGGDNYVTENLESVEKASIPLLEVLLSTANISTHNGVTSAGKTFDRATILKRIQGLKKKYGIEDVSGRTIKGITPW